MIAQSWDRWMVVVEALERILREEHSILELANYKAFQTLMPEKAALILEIEALQEGTPIEIWKRGDCPAALKEGLKTVRQLNESNGVLINATHQYLDKLKKALYGVFQNAYDAKAMPVDSQEKPILGKA